MNDSENIIGEEFAKKLLAALYKLDNPGNKFLAIINDFEDESIKKELMKIFLDMLSIWENDLMYEIYSYHSSLGRVSEPGEWFKRENLV